MLKIAELAEDIKKKNGGKDRDDRGGHRGYRHYNNRDNRDRNQHGRGRRNERNRNDRQERNDRPYRNDQRRDNSSLAEQNRKFSKKDDKNGWASPEVKALLGAGAVIGGGVAASKGQITPDSKYFKDASNKAFQGAKKYMGKNSKPLTRVITNVFSRSFKDIKKGFENPHKTRASRAMEDAKETSNRAGRMNDHIIKQKAAESFQQAKNYNAFERELANKEGRVPNFMEEDFEYHMNRAKEDLLKSRPKSEPKKNKFQEAKNVIGTSLLGGSSFGIGLSAIHGIEKALESKDDEEKNRKRREQQFRSLGSFV